MPRIVTVDEFCRLQDSQDAQHGRLEIRSRGAADLENSSGRLIPYVLSDTSIGRDNHMVASDAWQTRNFLNNPVMLWAHDAGAPPIARWVDIESRGNRLVGTADYADRDTYPFADTIYRLVKGRFLNAVSTSWLPIEWKFSTDRSRPGGVDFFKVDLLEVSQVPVPALPTALATARAQGIDTGPLVEWAERLLDRNDFVAIPRSQLEALHREAKMPLSRKPVPDVVPPADWKVGCSRTLPIDKDAAWDADEALKTIFEHCGFGGDNPDVALARKAFLFFDAAHPKQRSSYKLPIAKVVDGRLTAVADGIREAAEQRRYMPVSISETVDTVLDDYIAKIGTRSLKLNQKRSLYQVGWLAYLLEDLGCLHSSAEYEAALEEDGSQVPAQLLAALKQLGQVLVAMTAEEVAELLAGKDEADELGVIEMASDAGVKRQAFNLLRRLDVGALGSLSAAMRGHIEGRDVSFIVDKEHAQVNRAGRVLSADNERCLREAHDHMTRAVETVRGVLDQVEDPDADDDNNGDADNERAIRVRRAKALKLKVVTTA